MIRAQASLCGGWRREKGSSPCLLPWVLLGSHLAGRRGGRRVKLARRVAVCEVGSPLS